MTNRNLKVYCCIPTPFDFDYQFDGAALSTLVNRIASAGVGIACGTASPGEGHSLTLAETEQFYGLAKETVGGRVPVVGMGCEPRNARDYFDLVRIAESVGLESMQLYSVDLGHGNHPSAKELETYFRTLLEGMRLPARISSHKASGYNVPLPVLERLLADYPIAAIHCITDDLAYLKRVVELCDGRADVLTGGLHQVLNVLAFGGTGFLDSTCALLAPRTIRSIIDRYMDKDLDGAASAHSQAVSLAMINRWTGPRTVKEAMHAVGLPGWTLRPPYLPLDEDDHRFVVETLANASVPELDELPWRA